MILVKRISTQTVNKITAESESTGEASATSNKKKRVNSKKRALTKTERKRLSERLHEADLPLLWHRITCKLNESRPTISESNSQSSSKSKKNDSSSWDGDSHAGHNDHDKLLTMVLSAFTASDLNKIVLHLYVCIQNVRVTKPKRNIAHSSLNGTNTAVPFYWKSLSPWTQ